MLPIIRFTGELPERLKGRSQLSDERVLKSVRDIIAGVRERGDAALIEYTRMFDHAEIAPGALRVSEQEIDTAYEQVDDELLNAIRASARRIRAYHEKQKTKTWLDFGADGYALGQKITPMSSAAVYVPGGTAMYPSSVLMNVIPASVAGVERIAMLTPPMKDGSVYPLTLVTAREAGVTEVYRVGGAQAIAAAAFGTESIARVDKITGPGNIYVANAKREVYGYVGIDMIAGPSEVLLVADSSAPARYVAADMLSQAEHDALAQAVLITDSEELALEVQRELPAQLAALDRAEIAGRSIDDYGTILLCDSIEQGIAAANMVAPEHLELMLSEPFAYLGQVKNAGAIFLGRYSPEPLGDYYAGPNHVLPTSGTARFSSPLSVDDFIKKSSIIYCGREQLREAARDVMTFARAEGLDAHARSVGVRFEGEKL